MLFAEREKASKTPQERALTNKFRFPVTRLPDTALFSSPYRTDRCMTSKAGGGSGVDEGGREKLPLGGRGACRATAPSIAPPVTKKKTRPAAAAAAAAGSDGGVEMEEEEPSEKDNAKRILRTLATHLWPSKELQVMMMICMGNDDDEDGAAAGGEARWWWWMVVGVCGCWSVVAGSGGWWSVVAGGVG